MKLLTWINLIQVNLIQVNLIQVNLIQVPEMQLGISFNQIRIADFYL